MEKFSKGITLVEVMVAVSIIAVITGVIVSDFPRIKLQLSLGRALHTMAQDIKTAQALSGSGKQEVLSDGTLISPRGYGFYIDKDVLGNKKYIIYADINGDHQYNGSIIDYNVKEVDLAQQESGIIIKEIHNANNRLSINFSPPNFATNISDLLDGHDGVEVIIAIESDQSATRTIYVNKAGLIELK